MSARHHDDAAYRHRDAARGPSNGPLQTPRGTKENDLNHSARAVALGGDAYSRNAAADDVLSTYGDPQEHDTEQCGHDVSPYPPQDLRLHLGATLRDMGDRRQHISFSDATRFCTRAPPPVLIREDQTQFTSTHATSRPLEQHTAYARIERDAESFRPFYPDMAYRQTYGDIMRSDDAPHYAGSPSSSGSSITAVDAPYKLGLPVNMDIVHGSTISEPTPAHQHQTVSVPYAAFPPNPNQLGSTRAEPDASPASFMSLFAAHGGPYSNGVHEVYSTLR